MFHRITLLLLVSSFLLGCKGLRYGNEQLLRAEQLLEEAPDSSLSFLVAMDSESLVTKKQRAHYALLLTASRDRNYIDVSSDSLISIALDYYSPRSISKERMMSWYYNGVILKNSGSFAQAIVSFEKALEDAESLGNLHFAGLIYRNIGSVFDSSNNFSAAIDAHRKSIDCFRRTNEPLYLNYANLSLAIGYLNNHSFSSALNTINAIRDSCDTPEILSYCNMVEAAILSEKETAPERVVSLYRDESDMPLDLIDHIYMAKALDDCGENMLCDEYLEKGYAMAKDEADSATVDYVRSKILFKRGRLPEAFCLLDNATSVQDSLTRFILKESVSSAQRDYFREVSDKEKKLAKSLRIRAVLYLVIALLLIVGISLFGRLQSKRHELKIKELMADRAVELSRIKQLNTDKASLVGQLFSERLSHLDILSKRYFSASDNDRKEYIYQEFRRYLHSLRDDKKLFETLENDLDRYCDGIMTKLRVQVPAIKDNNLKLVCLFFAQFSYTAISLIMGGASIQSLKTARSRCRAMIKQSEAMDKSFFLEMLSVKKEAAEQSND